ncbi:MAG: hypothetical protein H6822_18705 [Planctomycetaceae bacterium]|nr:hypothetical protein [Planctomycetales bacterium]MCB9924219.1 hypothetical protein [Planctomycetaceae bacterium]
MMRSLTTVLLVLAARPYATAQQNSPTIESSGLPAASERKVSMHEEVWLRLADEPSRLMKQADENFLRRKYEMAADQLHRAGAYLHGAASHADKETKSALEASAAEVDRLTAGIKSGVVASRRELEDAFARAEYALAAYQHLKAKEALDRRDYKIAGTYLDTAVTHAENTARWMGHELEASANRIVESAYATSGELVNGAGFVVRDVEGVMDDIGAELEKLGMIVNSPHRHTKSGR